MYLFDFFRLVPRRRKVKLRAKKGVIFNNPSGVKRYIFYISNIIFLVGIGYLVTIYYPIGQAWYRYKTSTSSDQTNQVGSTEPIISGNNVTNNKFRIEIPKILAEASVITNIDPTDKETMDKVLKNGKVALKSGSNMPGDGDGSSLFVFAHSTELGIFSNTRNSVFYLLNELENEDKIYIYFNGNKYEYLVENKLIVGAKDTQYLDYRQEGGETLILQTCWPLGTNWRRLLVFAKRTTN